MADLTQPSRRRQRPVRLTDIPLEQRYSAARRLARHLGDQEQALALIAAALAPSRTVYYVKP